MTHNIAIWQPHTDREVMDLKHTAGLYGAGVLEVYDVEQLRGLLAKHDATLVCLELDPQAQPLEWYSHPDRALYLVGPTAGTIPKEVLHLPGSIVRVETLAPYPLKPHVAGAIVLHHRHITQIGARV